MEDCIFLLYYYKGYSCTLYYIEYTVNVKEHSLTSSGKGFIWTLFNQNNMNETRWTSFANII